MKKIFLLILLGFSGLLIVLFLFFLSRKDPERKNGFNRSFSTTGLKQLHVFDLKYANYYFSGLSHHHVFLGNHQATLHGLMISIDLKDTVHMNTPHLIKDTINLKSIKVQIDSPNVYYVERQTPSYFQSSIPVKVAETVDLAAIKFDRIKVLSKSSMVIRLYQAGKRVLQKIIVHPVLQKSTVFPLSDQLNNDFSVDGVMSYNKLKNKLFYINYYSNRLVCLDTNLNLVYRAHTIDTNTTAKIKVSVINKAGSTEKLMSAPPLRVNKKAWTDGNWLYINSLLASDQENLEEFKNYTIVDVYAIGNGKYTCSFKVPDYKEKKLTDFCVSKNTLIALYDQYLISYEIPL
jgi:hypothetical protein